MLSSSSNEQKKEVKDSDDNKDTLNQNDKVRTITTDIPMKGELIQRVEEQKRGITVTVPCVPPYVKKQSSSSINSENSEDTVTVPATEIKKITTVQKICPKRVQTLVIKELDPVITVTEKNNKQIKEVKTPISKHLTTTTTIRRTTLVTTETTTIIGPDNKQEKGMAGVLLEARPYRPFKSSEEYLYAMKEDLAEWLNMLYSELQLNVDNFMDKLETGVVLCKHANSVKKSAEEYVARKHLRKMTSSQSLTASLMTRTALPITRMGEIIYRESAKPGTFFARDNVSNFIDFCRHGLEILECLLFETDDLIMRKNEKNVILCLLEVARRGAKFGMLAPILVQMEREIDREIAAEQRLANGEDEDSSEEEELIPYGPIPQIVTNDLKSLDEMVRDLVEKCTCPTQFPMIRVSEGKYRIGDTKILIFVRILRSHVMVRVGGGWDTLSHYLDKHDPCRCRTGHKTALSSKLILKNHGAIELNNAEVHYERSPPRTRRSSASSSSSGHGGRDTRDFLSSYSNLASRSRSPTPKRGSAKNNLQPSNKYISTFLYENGSNSNSDSYKRGRSVSPICSSRRSYDASTLASRNRSRSPSVRSPERQKKNNIDIVNNVKQNDVKYLTVGELNKFESEQTQRAKVALEANELSNNDDSKQNDSGSEVSDEGYRSLGLIVTSPLVGEGKIVPNAIKSKSEHSGNLFEENSESKECYPSIDDETQVVGDGIKKKLDRKSVSHECSLEPRKTTLKTVPSKNSSRVNSRSSSPARHTQSQTPSRRYSQVNEYGTYKRSLNKENDSRKVPRSRSATSSRSASESLQYSKPTKNGSSTDKFGTWNGKSKKRSGIYSENSSNFVRNGVGRCSLGAHTSAYDTSSGKRLQKQKEQKCISPLLADLLKTKNLDDDKTILLKMKEIISQYSGIFEEPDNKYNLNVEDLDFTREWVKSNESIKRLDSGDGDEKSSPSKRKDSKYEGPHSKIPAPVFFKQQILEKEGRI